TENYLMNFPQIEGLGGGSANGTVTSGTSNPPNKTKGQAGSNNVNLFPGSKYRMLSGRISGNDYEEEFPGLAPGTNGNKNKASAEKTTVAATAASVKYKPQNWQTPAPNPSQVL